MSNCKHDSIELSTFRKKVDDFLKDRNNLIKLAKILTYNVVSTKNPRISAHIAPEQAEIIEAYMAKYDRTQSEAIRDALDILFGLDEADRDALVELARQARRNTGDQGSVILAAAIRVSKKS